MRAKRLRWKRRREDLNGWQEKSDLVRRAAGHGEVETVNEWTVMDQPYQQERGVEAWTTAVNVETERGVG